MRTEHLRGLAAALLAAAALACSKEAQLRSLAEERAQILKDIPVLPASILTDTTGDADAEHMRYMVQIPFDSVNRFYRQRLVADGWALMSDQSMGRDTVALMMRKAGATLWLRLSYIGPLATEYDLIATARSGTPQAPPQQ